ncbi:unnamed protein product [Allacma fusca]|uniref:Uncharacterized protein n=1 Tax=Allacma fusca TaxID=39272 RepID=A0A8J2KHN2_9HEXA|nr:unnamed protein product [Allacma fusca]
MPCSKSCPYITCPNDPCGPFSNYPYLPCRAPVGSANGGPCRTKGPHFHNLCCCGKMRDDDDVSCSGVYICRDGLVVGNCSHSCCRNCRCDNCCCHTCQNPPGKCCGKPPTSVIPMTPCSFFPRNCESCRYGC